MKFHYVYVLQSQSNPARRYVGYTQDLAARLASHNHGDTPSTKAFIPWQIETAIAFRDPAKALAFEKYLKSHSGPSFSSRHF